MALLEQAYVEALDVVVLRGTAWLAVAQIDLLLQARARTFWFVAYARHTTASKVFVHFQNKTLAGESIHYS
jgi:hypothetical protein